MWTSKILCNADLQPPNAQLADQKVAVVCQSCGTWKQQAYYDRRDRYCPSLISSALLRSAVASQVKRERGVRHVNLVVVLVIFVMGRTLSR
jgi:hypothetical protein